MAICPHEPTQKPKKNVKKSSFVGLHVFVEKRYETYAVGRGGEMGKGSSVSSYCGRWMGGTV